MKRNWSRCVIGFIVLTLLLSMPFFAYKVKDEGGTLSSLAYTVPELRLPETGEASWAIKDMYVSQMGVEKFLSENSGDWVVFVDLRRGVPTLLDGGALPIIPGVMNTLSWDGFANGGCRSIQCLSRDKVEELAREFLDRYPGLFPVKQEELVLDPNGSVAIGESIYLLRFQWVVDGIPVEGASIYFRINNGNLLQVASSRIAPMDLDTTPTLSVNTAWDILNGYLGDAGVTEKDEIVERGKLTIIPVTPKGMDPDVYAGTVGGQAGFVLAYNLKFTRPGIMGTWEAVIDAHTGEILRFVDANRYGRIHGGAKPSDGLPPDEDRPFPYADTGLASPNEYTDAAGMFTGNNATTTLTGKYAHISDNCGSISLTTTTGDADFLTDLTSGTDCTVPAGNTAGAGNTKSSRTLFYNTTAINLKAQTYNPSNTWLTSNYVILHVNSASNCNAGSSGLNIYFYQHDESGCPSDQWTCCNNLGEIPGVAMHEWAHSYDTNDGSGGQSPPLETYSDWTAIIQTHNSCTGAGFFKDGYGFNCDGYGDACTDCTGIRECDYTKHASNTPWTSANYGSVWSGCDSGSYFGPCGWEDHCESGISTQALWDFVYRDLPTQCSMDLTSAWMLEDRLWFAGVATIDAMYTCTSGTTDGCTGNVLYTVMRALDDDGDGTANGTPHAHAIFHALDRHNIDCSTYNDSSPQNANQTSCPSLSTPTLSGTAGNNSVALSWTTGGANATRYFIYKNESSCDVAFTRIATVTAPTLTYTDTACANGMTYYYRVQAATANDSCVSPSSNCITATPQPCTASVILNQSIYTCSSTVNVAMLDSTPGASPWTATAWSTSDSTPRSFTLTGTVPNLSGTFTTTTGTGGPGVVHVAAGDTLTVRFVDPDNCGGGSYNANATATIDCTGPTISDVAVSNITGTTATVTWTTNEAANSRVTYGLSVPPGTNQDNLASYVTNHSINLTGLTTCSQHYFSVTSADVAGNSSSDTNGGAYYTFTTPNVNQTVWSENFAGVTPTALPAGWTTYNAGSGNNWVTNASGCTNNALMYPYSSSYAANAWAFTPGMTLTAGITYTVSVNQKVYSGSYPEIFEIRCGSAATPAGQTITALGSAEYANTSCQGLSGTFTVPTTGTYYLSFHCTSEANMWNLYIDDIVLSKPGSCTAELEYDSHTMTEACNGSGTGGGNSVLEPGEDATLSITMENVGGAATGISATLSSSTTGVTVTTASANYPNIGAGATGTSLTNYVVHVDPSVTCVTTANFTLHSTSTQNPAGTDSYFSMNVGQAGGAVSDFSQSFASVTPPALPTGWTESHTSGNAWVTTASYYCTAANGLYYPYNGSAAANSYVYTPGIALTSGVTYTLNFNQKVQSATYPEIFEVKCGTAATPAGQTITILASASYTNTTCTLRSPTFTVPTTGTYYISWHCTSAADMYYLIIDDINLTHSSSPVCNVCTGGCTGNPGAPVITGITNVSACLLDGIQIAYTAGSGATRHDLYRDGGLVVTDYASGAVYVPGNSASHSYVVRAVCGSYYTNSTPMAGTDTGCPTLVYSTHGTPTQITGDGDANYELGEKWSVSATLQNTGGVQATNVYATLAGNGITVCTPSMSYGTIAAGATASATYEFVISTSFTPCGGTIGFDVTNKTCTETCNGCGDETDVFTLTVGQPGAGTVTLFGPDDLATPATNWTLSNYRASTASTCHTAASAETNFVGTSYLTKTVAVSTVGYTNITVHYDWRVTNATSTQYLDWSTDGSTWNSGVASINTTTWLCNQSTVLPAGAAGQSTLYIRFRTVCVTNANRRGQVDYISITGDNGADCSYVGSGTCSSCTMTTDVTPNGTTTVCGGQNIVYTATPTGGTSPYTYQWTENGSDITGANSSTYTANKASGSYTYNCKVSDSGACANITDATSPTGTWTALPAAPTAGNNGPICAGATLNLTASTISGATYAWTGPNGFTSAIQNPSITNATTAATGTYSVTATVSGCTGAAGTTVATVNANPVPTVSGDSVNTCPSETVLLTTESGMSSYQWYNGGSPIGGATSNTYTVTASGTYTVSYTNGSGCSGTSAGHAVTINSCAVIPGEVASGTNFTWSGQTMSWTADGNATGYRVYRGLLSNLSALCDGTNDFCLRYDGASTSLDVSGDDPSGQSGRCYFYLITGYSGAGEGPAGPATCGARQVNSSGGCS